MNWLLCFVFGHDWLCLDSCKNSRSCKRCGSFEISTTKKIKNDTTPNNLYSNNTKSFRIDRDNIVLYIQFNIEENRKLNRVTKTISGQTKRQKNDIC